MPEGPEVRIITDQLAKFAVGKTLTLINILDGRFIESPPENLKEIRSDLPLQISQIQCKGKFIYWTLSQDWILANTLGMTGKWSWASNQFSALQLKIEDQNIFFEDVRRFGTIKFWKDNQLKKKLQELGPDMLSAPPKDTEFLSLMRAHNKNNVCQALMNQKIISGVGNYIKSEALFRSGINPNKLILDLGQNQLKQLRLDIIDVMTESYNQQGATLRDYQHLEGSGKFADFFKVYSKKACPLGHPVSKTETLDKRTSWFCPTCQPER